MSVSFPSMPWLNTQYLAFTTPSARDAFMRLLEEKSAAAHDRAAAAARAEDERKATSAHHAAAEAVAAAPAIAHALQSSELGKGVQDVVARIASNATTEQLTLSGECAAADGAAAVALLQMQGRGFDCGLWCCGLLLVCVFGLRGVRVVDCVCATEPPSHQTAE